MGKIKDIAKQPIIEWGKQVVITTAQLAKAYGATTKNISNNFNRNKDRFEEGKHYFLLQGEELKDFMRVSSERGQAISPSTSIAYLWTRRGASRHCKILDTDKAWEQFDFLEENYFDRQEKKQLDKMQIRIYKNNKWYILTMGDNVYSLKPEEAVTINRCVSAMLKNGATQIEGVINSLLDGFGRDCRLECINQCSIPLKIGIEEKEGGAE